LPPPQPEAHDAAAIRAWNLMGGAIDWTALSVIAEMLGVEDVEAFVVRLAAIRDWQQNNRD
jgi:hypothetical protein